jgi:SAM-dependent methyltransferase
MPDGSCHDTLAPSPWVVRFAPLLTPGVTVLDLACGRGRHVRLLLERGHKVVALDRDAEALAGLGTPPSLEVVAADLEDGSPWPLGARRFGGIVVTNYLHRPLFPALVAALAPGGLLIYETFARGNERFGRPRNPDHLLNQSELLEVVRPDCTVLAYEALEVGEPAPAVIQRVCARRHGS